MSLHSLNPSLPFEIWDIDFVDPFPKRAKSLEKKYIITTSECFLRKRVAFLPRFLCPLLGIFWHMVFADGFLFPVKELGLLTNPGHWVRVLDATGSYMYIVL
jgi:hypothetical protein